MMSEAVDDILRTRATEMASNDGVAVDVAHIQGAASELQFELIKARDQMVVATLGSAPGSAHAGPPTPAKAETPAAETDGLAQ